MADEDRDKNRDVPNQNNITQDGDPAGKADPAVRPVGTDDPNVERLREDIDSGKTGDKVGYPDPAAAPLGADAEAGGARPRLPKSHRHARTRSQPARCPDGRYGPSGEQRATGTRWFEQENMDHRRDCRGPASSRHPLRGCAEGLSLAPLTCLSSVPMDEGRGPKAFFNEMFQDDRVRAPYAVSIIGAIPCRRNCAA